MTVGLGRDDGPFFFSCPGRKQHLCCRPGPTLLCMGLFSRFCLIVEIKGVDGRDEPAVTRESHMLRR
jgi:hypothetical protein